MLASFTPSLPPKPQQPSHVHKAQSRGLAYWLLTVTTVLLLLGAASSQQAQAGVCFFEHVNYGGNARCTTQTQVSWINNALGHGWNDRVSSIIVNPRTCIALYEHINYGGRVHYYCGSVPSLPGMNDRTSSFLIFYF